MRSRVNNSAAVLQRRQAQLRGGSASASANALRHNRDHDNDVAGGSGASLPSMEPIKILYSQCFPTPNISVDGLLTFEVIIFAYSMVAMMLQLLHLYRSVFWLPTSYNKNALNWHLIEWNLVIFAGIFLSRRICWITLKAIISWLTPIQWTPSFIIVARSVTTLASLVALFVVIYSTMMRYPILNLLYLIYPAVVYFIVFGFSGEPYLELIPHTTQGKMKIFKDKTGSYRTSYFAPGMSLPSPDNVRMECQLLRDDFNLRLKQVAFNSICSAYYTTFIPCVFTQNVLHFETTWVGRHVMLTWVGCCSLYISRCFPGCYLHLLHRCAAYLGGWTRIEGRVSPTFYSLWSPNVFWPGASIVRLGKGDLYKADGVANAAEPGDVAQANFYNRFRDVSLFSWFSLILQSGLVLAQHVSLTWSHQWYMLISEAILLFANYYCLFKCIRDYLVYFKVQTSEQDLLKELTDNS